MENQNNQAQKEPTLSLAQRFLADSSPFFKVLGAIGATLMAIATPLYKLPFIPQFVPVMLTTAGAAFLLAMFLETKVAVIIQNPNATLNDYLSIIPELQTGLTELKQSASSIADAIQNPANAKPFVAPEVTQNITVNPPPVAAPATVPAIPEPQVEEVQQ